MFKFKVTVQETSSGQKIITIPKNMAEFMEIEKGDSIIMTPDKKKRNIFDSQIVKKGVDVNDIQ